MNTWLTQIKREFWEHQSMFVFLPLIVAGLIVLAGIYIVIFEASPDSEFALDIFNEAYFQDAGTSDGGGEVIDFSSGENEGTVAADGADEEPVEYIIDFTTGELKVAEDIEVRRPMTGEVINATLYGFHSMLLMITGFVLLFYLLSCLHTDRKDRSVLFWKSLPVSETRNVVTKLIIASVIVPLLVTVISWVVQICYLFLSMIFMYRIGSEQWTQIWPQADLFRVFFEQVKLVLWIGAWFLPLNAWWLFASALGKRSPFLVAIIPFAVVIGLEYLFLDSTLVGSLLLEHLNGGGIQLGHIMGEDQIMGAAPGSVDLFLNNSEMFAGFVIAGVLVPVTIWLRNHRFEI